MSGNSAPAGTVDSSMGLPPGQLVGGRFEVVGTAGEDAIGVVLRAKDTKTGKAIALRVLRSGLLPAKDSVQALRDTCREAAGLRHRNIVATYGVGSAPGNRQFVACEWADGQSLADLLAARRKLGRPISLRGAFNVVTAVGRALSEAHGKTCHGALRPSVIWISTTGRVQVGDFGVAKAVLACAGPGGLGATEQACLAPEVKSGKPPTPRSDIFGLGAVLYEILTGRSPADGFVPPSQAHPDATPELDQILLRCLAGDPAARFEAPEEISTALRPLVDLSGPPGDDFDLDIDLDAEAAPRAADLAKSAAAAPAPAAPGSRGARPPIPAGPARGHAAAGGSAPGDSAPGGSAPGGSAPRGSAPRGGAPPSPPSLAAHGAPQAGARVSLHEPFRPSAAGPQPAPLRMMAGAKGANGAAPGDPQGDPARHGDAVLGTAASPTDATPRVSNVDLKGMLEKITVNDAPRWMLVKDNLDHGPFSGRELVDLILKDEVQEQHGLLNMDTGDRKAAGEYPDFVEFLAQAKMRRQTRQEKAQLARADRVEKASTAVKVAIFGAIVALLGVVGLVFLLSRQGADDEQIADTNLADLYERGDIEITGTAGILPAPRGAGRSKRRGRRGGGGSSGASGSYEDAMNQAVELGDVSKQGSERQLSSADVAGIMNRHINRMFTCVGQELRRGGQLSSVQIDMAILGSGQVQGVSVRQGSPAFGSCIAGQVRSVRFPTFPAPRMGARYSFTVD